MLSLKWSEPSAEAVVNADPFTPIELFVLVAAPAAQQSGT